MTVRKVQWSRFVLLSVALGFASIGCNGNDDEEDDKASCSSICEDAKDCPDADPNVDCDEACDSNEALVDRAGCSGEYDDLVECMDHVSDICRVSEDTCRSENEAAVRCLTAYCENHLDECASAGT